MALAALEEVPLSAPHLQLPIDIVEFTERRRESPSGSFRAVVAAIHASWEDLFDAFFGTCTVNFADTESS